MPRRILVICSQRFAPRMFPAPKHALNASELQRTLKHRISSTFTTILMRKIQLFLFTNRNADAKKRLNKWFTITQPVIERAKIQTEVWLTPASLKFAFTSMALYYYQCIGLSVFWVFTNSQAVCWAFTVIISCNLTVAIAGDVKMPNVVDEMQSFPGSHREKSAELRSWST